ncbi:MAG: UMP kinase [Candidatus Micrarchaeia archaeon]
MSRISTVVLSLGGSLIAPDDIDTSFLKRLRSLVLRHIRSFRFIIVCGGGRTARKYQTAAKHAGASKDDLDWIGIIATKLNAWLVKSMFGKLSDKDIVSDPTKRITAKSKIVVAAGWRPGFSTDYDAVLLAKQTKADAVINLTNVDYVYDKDPRKHRDAKPISSITWKEYRQLVGGRWIPGLNIPFDPIAANEAEKSGIKVLILNGKNIKNVENAVLGRRFRGTVIQ